MPNQQAAPLAKKGLPGKRKTKSGCRTCKIRRVKCDEARPACQRCVATGRVCDGYGIWGGGGTAPGTIQTSATMQISHRVWPVITNNSVAVHPSMTEPEQVALDFFKYKTSTKMPGIFDSDFWAKLVFQASFNEPAVFHAVIALAATHRSGATYPGKLSSPADDMTTMDANEKLALQHYNKAIRHLQLHLENKQGHSLRIALISCMIFLCMELLRGQFRSGRAHLRGALQLLQEIQKGEGLIARDPMDDAEQALLFLRPQPESVDDHLVEAFTRLNVQSALFGQGSEFLYKMGTCARRVSNSGVPATFDSIGVARRHLDALINGVYLLSAQIDRLTYTNNRILDHLVRHKAQVQSSLALWLETYTASLPSFDTEGERAFLGLPLLRMYHTMATIMAATCLRGTNELALDSHTSAFASILGDAAKLWRRVMRLKLIPITGKQHQDINFTIDMGFIPPLYYTALKCRVPRFRRFAMRLLATTPHREGVWDGSVAAGAARKVMEMEEGGFYEGVEAGFVTDALKELDEVPADDLPLVPGDGRVSCVVVRLPEGLEGDVTLECTRYRGGKWETIELNAHTG